MKIKLLSLLLLMSAVPVKTMETADDSSVAGNHAAKMHELSEKEASNELKKGRKDLIEFVLKRGIGEGITTGVRIGISSAFFYGIARFIRPSLFESSSIWMSPTAIWAYATEAAVCAFGYRAYRPWGDRARFYEKHSEKDLGFESNEVIKRYIDAKKNTPGLDTEDPIRRARAQSYYAQSFVHSLIREKEARNYEVYLKGKELQERF